MSDLKNKITELIKKADRRILIRISVVIVVAAGAFVTMEFMGGKPVAVVATVKQTKPDKKTKAKSDKPEMKTIVSDTNDIDSRQTKKQIDVNSLAPDIAAKTADNIQSKIGKTAIPVDENINNLINNTVNTLTDTDSNDTNYIDTNISNIEPNNTETTINLEPDYYVASEIQSLVFMKNMEIQDALHLLAARYKRNIVPSPDVSGQLAFENLYEVTFEEAMEAILGTDFRYEQKGNLIKVYPAEKGEMVHKVFTLYYINAAEAKKLVTQVLSREGKIEVTTAAETGTPSDETISSQTSGGDNTAMNDTLIIYDYHENIKKAEQVIASIDVRPMQVLIEATILSATLNEGLQVGIDWNTLKNVVVQELGDLTYDTGDFYGSGGTSARIGASSLSGGLTIGLVHDDVAGFIRAVEEVTDVTILANPKIMAVNKQLGQIYIGKKVAYRSQTTQTDTSTTEQVQFLDTGTKLSFRPFIGDDGFIRMDIHPKDSSATLRTSGTTTLPDETSAELVTNIIVKNGQTIVIGGLFRERITTTRTQIPVLGDLPLVGGLFRGTADDFQREEVIVLLTPHIISDPNQADGQKQNQDIQRKYIGARDELQWINKVRRANEHYDNAAEFYLQGEHNAAIRELNAALKLYPAYLEAIRLKELIARELTLKRLKKNLDR